MAVTGAYDPANESREQYDLRQYELRNARPAPSMGAESDKRRAAADAGFTPQVAQTLQGGMTPKLGVGGFDPVGTGMNQMTSIMKAANQMKANAAAPATAQAPGSNYVSPGQYSGNPAAFQAGANSGVNAGSWLNPSQAIGTSNRQPAQFSKYDYATQGGQDLAAQKMQEILGGKVGNVVSEGRGNPILQRPDMTNLVVNGKIAGNTGLLLDYASKYGWEAASALAKQEMGDPNAEKDYDEKGEPIRTQTPDFGTQPKPYGIQYPQAPVTPAAGQQTGGGGGGPVPGGGTQGGGAGGQGGQVPGQTGGGGGTQAYNPYNPYAPGGAMQGGGQGGAYNPFASLGGGQQYGGQQQYSLGQSQYGGQQGQYAPSQYNPGSAYGTAPQGGQQGQQSIQQMLAMVQQLQGGAMQPQLQGPSRVRTPLGYTRWNRGPQTNQYMQGTYPSPQNGMQQMQQLPPQMQQMLMAQLLGGAGMQQGG